MMQLYIKENKKNTHRMSVRDERGQILYIIEGRWGRKDDITSIYHLDGERILSVKQVKNTPLPMFEIIQDGKEIASMRKHPGLFGLRDSYFTIHPFNWVVTGDFEELYFTVHEEQRLIMECEKDLYSQYAVYELTINDEMHAPTCALISTLFDPFSRNKEEEDEQEELTRRDYDWGFSQIHLSNLKIKTR